MTWHLLHRFPDTCDEETTRDGYLVPCEKPAVAARRHDGQPYPVCAYHARGPEMVPLRELLENGEGE